MTRDKIVNGLNSNVFNQMYFWFFCLLPLIYTEQAIDPVLLPRQIYLTVFLFTLCISILNQIYKRRLIADFSFMRLALPLMFLLFVILNFISTFQAVAISEAYYVSSKMATELLFFVVTTYLLINEKLSIHYLAKSIVVFVAISLLIAVYQLYDAWGISDFKTFIYQICSTYGNKNLFSSILFLALPFVLIFGFISKRWSLVSYFVLIATLVLLVFIQTRIVLIALILSFVIYFLMAKPSKDKSVKFKRLFLILLFFSFISLVWFALTYKSIYFSTIFNSKSVFERISIWDNSVQMSKDHFWTGVGAGNWQIYFPKYGLEHFIPNIQNGVVSFQRPHNDFLWVLCETGLIGLLSYASIFCIILFYSYKIVKQSGDEDRKIYLLFFAFVIGYIFISLVDFPLERIEHQLIFCTLCSIVTAKYFTLFHSSKTSEKPILPYLVGLFCFIVLLFSFTVSIQRFVGEFHTRKMYEAQNNSEWNLMSREADQSVNPFYTMDPMSVPINWYKGVALFSMGNVEGALSSFEKADVVHPYNIHVMNNMGSCYEVQKKHELAISCYVKALNISPTFEEARLNLSAVYFNIGNFHQALATIDNISGDVESKEKYNTYLTAILNSLLKETLKKQTDAVTISKLEQLQKSDSTVRAVYFLAKLNSTDFEKFVSAEK